MTMCATRDAPDRSKHLARGTGRLPDFLVSELIAWQLMARELSKEDILRLGNL
jgi:hypothetical protein